MKIYMCGGGVRDRLLGSVPKDHDWVIVGATEADVHDLVAQGYTWVGVDFPVLLHPTTHEEYALARVERKNGVGYHGFEVTANEHVTIEEDLARRDLTINSMAMLDNELVDPYGGLHDLHNHVLRHTSPAFIEDPLRVLRLARFAARLKNFKIAPCTVTICKELTTSGELNHLSAERIWIELDKGLGEDHPTRFMEVLDQVKALEHCNLLKSLFGAKLSERQRAICKVLNSVSQESRSIVGIASLAGTIEVPGVSRRIMELYNNLKQLHDTSRDVFGLFNLLKRAGALREGHTFLDLTNASMVMELAGAHCAFSTRQLLIGANIIRAVKAVEFAETGKDLGAAIDKRRVADLERALFQDD